MAPEQEHSAEKLPIEFRRPAEGREFHAPATRLDYAVPLPPHVVYQKRRERVLRISFRAILTLTWSVIAFMLTWIVIFAMQHSRLTDNVFPLIAAMISVATLGYVAVVAWMDFIALLRRGGASHDDS